MFPLKKSSAANVEVDFESLLPILKRKFFSNVERIRIRRAQADHFDDLDYNRPNLACTPRHLHFCALRSRPYSTVAGKSFNRKRRLQKPSLSGSSAKFRKPGPSRVAHLAKQVDLHCYVTLPPNIQRKIFSDEERHQLHQAYCSAEVLDPTDSERHRLKKTCRPNSSADNFLLGTTAILLSHPSPADVGLSEVDLGGDMDESLYDSFRWLDEDGELDLTLDEYHAHVVNSTTNLPSRKRPSFRRTWSLNSVSLGQKHSSSVPQRIIPNSSQSSTVPSSLTNIVGRGSTSRPQSRQRQAYHAPRSSTSSIDPSAQYYQDPEARLKLRVYLASPQNFDEAVEFGFPALREKDDKHPERSQNIPKSNAQESIGTFLEDDDASTFGEREGKYSTVSRLSYVVESSLDSQSSIFQNDTRRQTWIPTETPAHSRHLSNREMTLKMTLTRPDLRTESPELPSPATDPLKLKDFPPGSRGSYWGGTERPVTSEQSLMKKMWRKIRR